jgi:stearoyl-CoA desaturase (delta-9 desaturase)
MSLLVDSNDDSAAVPTTAAAVLDNPLATHPAPLTTHAVTQSKRRPDKPLQVGDPWEGGLDWGTIIWFSIVHAGALAAPFFFTWKALGLFFGMYWLTGGVGICLGYHRLLTHGSFQTYRPVKWLIAFLGGLAGEGSAVIWVANHRKHHAYSDKEGDPHSPRDGGLWSHMLWFMPNFGRKWHDDMGRHFAPDLVKDPVIRFLDKTFLLWFFVLGGALWSIGYFCWDAYTAWSFVVWGMFVRMVWVYHITWFVNSATHIWGYRNYETTDDSKNLWWVGLLGWGEGWHNNHHAYQRMARHGHKWWEVDLTYYAICTLEKVGLAWNVVHKVPAWQKPE